MANVKQQMELETSTHFVQKPANPAPLAAADIDFSQVTVVGLPVPVIPGQGSRIISGGGVAWTGTGLNFIVSAAQYMINGIIYTSPQTNITLAASDPTNDRIDTFALTNLGTAVAITGIPAGPPLEPPVNPLSQVRDTTAYIAAGSSTPLITNEFIYLENTEWTTSASGTFNPNSTNNPFAGLKDVEGTNAAQADQISFTKPAAGTVVLSNYASLVLQLRFKSPAWPNSKSFSVYWMNSGVVSGSVVTVKPGLFGLNGNNFTTYQQVVIPVSSFNTGFSPVNALVIAVAGAGANIGFYLDNILLQTGTAPPPVGGDFSTNTNVSVVGELVEFADTTGKLGKRSTGTGIVQLSNGVQGLVTIGANLTYNTLTNTLSSTGGTGQPAPVTFNDYTVSYSVPDTGNLLQPTRATLSSTNRLTLGGTGRETIYDPANSLGILSGKGNYEQPFFILRQGEFLQQFQRLTMSGSDRFVATEDARVMVRGEPQIVVGAWDIVVTNGPNNFSTTATTNLDILSAPVAANSVYEVESMVVGQTSGASGVKFTLFTTSPTPDSAAWGTYFVFGPATLAASSGGTNQINTQVGTAIWTTASTAEHAFIKALLRTGVTAGIVTVQVQAQAAGTTIIYPSVLKLRK